MINELFTNTALQALLGVLLVTVLADVLTGVYAAIRGKTFDLAWVDAFVKEHLLFKLQPILAGAIFAQLTTGIVSQGLWGAALAATTAYEAATFKGILDNLSDANREAPHYPEGVVPVAAEAP